MAEQTADGAVTRNDGSIAATLAAAAAGRPLVALLAGVGALTVWRLAMLTLNATDLYTYEAQYWFWSLEPALGYHSKPPLVAWVVWLTTAIGGEASTFWVRAAAPILHGVSALLVGALAAKLWRSPLAGLISGLAYATLPATSLGSQVISTDDVMLPFVAGAALLWLRLHAQPTRANAALLGLCVGFGLLAKYAMIYFVIGAALLWLVRRDWRIAPRLLAVAGGVAFALLAFNLGWNLFNNGVTLAYVIQHAGAAEGFPNFDSLAWFLAGQFYVMGPILLVGWLTTLLQRRDPPAQALLRWLSLPVFLIVCLQALRLEASAHWALAMVVAATPMAAMALHAHAPKLLAASFGLHLLFAVGLPVAATIPQSIPGPTGAPAFAPMLGQTALARELEGMAQRVGADVILADDPAVLAALTYALRDGDVAVRAPAPQGAADNHYQIAIPLVGAPGGVVMKVSSVRAPEPPPGFNRAELVREWFPDAPFLQGRPLFAYRFVYP